MSDSETTHTYDAVVIGCGGWGLAALKVLRDMGLDVLGLERGEICHNLTTYMPAMTVHSPLPYVVLDPEDFLLAERGDDYHSTIEELIQSYLDFAAKYDLPIQTHCTLRNIRGERGVKPSQEVVLMLQGGTARDKQLSETTAKLLQRQAKLRDEIVWLDAGDAVPASSVQLVHQLKVIVPFTDPDEAKAEQQRLSSEINKKQLTLDKLSSKLGNPNFIEKAPADVVAKEQARLDELSSQIETLRQQQVALEKIIGDNATT